MNSRPPPLAKSRSFSTPSELSSLVTVLFLPSGPFLFLHFLPPFPVRAQYTWCLVESAPPSVKKSGPFPPLPAPVPCLRKRLSGATSVVAPVAPSSSACPRQLESLQSREASLLACFEVFGLDLHPPWRTRGLCILFGPFLRSYFLFTFPYPLVLLFIYLSTAATTAFCSANESFSANGSSSLPGGSCLL